MSADPPRFASPGLAQAMAALPAVVTQESLDVLAHNLLVTAAEPGIPDGERSVAQIQAVVQFLEPVMGGFGIDALWPLRRLMHAVDDVTRGLAPDPMLIPVEKPRGRPAMMHGEAACWALAARAAEKCVGGGMPSPQADARAARVLSRLFRRQITAKSVRNFRTRMKRGADGKGNAIAREHFNCQLPDDLGGEALLELLARNGPQYLWR